MSDTKKRSVWVQAMTEGYPLVLKCGINPCTCERKWGLEQPGCKNLVAGSSAALEIKIYSTHRSETDEGATLEHWQAFCDTGTPDAAFARIKQFVWEKLGEQSGFIRVPPYLASETDFETGKKTHRAWVRFYVAIKQPDIEFGLLGTKESA